MRHSIHSLVIRVCQFSLIALITMGTEALATAPASPADPADMTKAATPSKEGSIWSREEQVTWPKTGIGIGFGSISGLSIYHTNASAGFIQGLIAFHSGGDFFASGDLCTHLKELFSRVPRLDPYYGFGAMVLRYNGHWHHFGFREFTTDDSKLMLGGRIPIGVNYSIPETPLQVNIQVAPGLLVGTGTFVTFEALTGLRVLF